jgi:transposase
MSAKHFKELLEMVQVNTNGDVSKLQLAKEIGIHVSTIFRWINKGVPADKAYAVKLVIRNHLVVGRV